MSQLKLRLQVLRLRMRIGEAQRTQAPSLHGLQMPTVQRLTSFMEWDEGKHPRGSNGRFIGGSGLKMEHEYPELRYAIWHHESEAKRYAAGGKNAKERKALQQSYLNKVQWHHLQGIAAMKERESELKSLLAQHVLNLSPREVQELQGLLHFYNQYTFANNVRPSDSRHTPYAMRKRLYDEQKLIEDHLKRYNREQAKAWKAEGKEGKPPRAGTTWLANRRAADALPKSLQEHIKAGLEAEFKSEKARENASRARREAAKAAWQSSQNRKWAAQAQARQQQLDAQIAAQREKVPPAYTKNDLHGTAMPFTYRDFHAALGSGQLNVQQGAINDTRIVRINGKDYIVKRQLNGAMNPDQAMKEQRNEAAVIAGFQIAGLGAAAPKGGWHVLGPNGEQYSVIAKATGSGQNFNRVQDIATKISESNLQQSALGVYLFGVDDRHAGNMLYNTRNGHVTQIDFGYSFRTWTTPHFGVLQTMSNMRQASKPPQERMMRFSPALVKSVLAKQEDTLTTLRRYGLSHDELLAVHQRYAVLAKAYRDRRGGPITDTDLQELAIQMFPNTF